MKPIIGVTCGIGTVIKNPSAVHMPQEYQQLAHAYVSAIERAGGIPLLIPIYDDARSIQVALDRVDGVVLTGGADIDPHHFGQRVSAKCGVVLPQRDHIELNVAKYILEATNKPLLGICRGIQVINVAMGGSLYQDLQEHGMMQHQLTMFPRHVQSHEVSIAPASRLEGILEGQSAGVNSFHHQAVWDVASGFRAVAWSEPDKVIEAIEMIGSRFVVGVQWHPEAMANDSQQQEIFRQFVLSC